MPARRRAVTATTAGAVWLVTVAALAAPAHAAGVEARATVAQPVGCPCGDQRGPRRDDCPDDPGSRDCLTEAERQHRDAIERAVRKFRNPL